MLLLALVPLALMVPLPLTVRERMTTIPPPAAPLVARPAAGVPVPLLVEPALPPPPIVSRPGDIGND